MKYHRLRASILFWFLFVGFLLVLARGVQIQLQPGEKIVELAENKSAWIKRKTNEESLTSRGSILDRNANELAISLISKSFFANPRQIENPRSVAYKLSRYLKVSPAKLEELLTQDRFFVWLKREVDFETARKIEALGLPGVHASKESQRIYPKSKLAKTILGFSGRDGSGLEGVEKSYDQWLKVGDQSDSSGIRDALGRKLRFKDFHKEWFEGNDVVLTVDLRLQKILEDEIRSNLKKTEAKSAQAIMMNPHTGEILAMASVDREPKAFRNRTISDVYEPGSTFKMLTAYAALANLHLSPSSQIFAENGKFKVGNRRVKEYNSKKYGWLTLEEVLALSSNIASAKLGLRLGAGNLDYFIEKFGFKERTGIDLPGEARSIVRNHRTWKPIELANIAFGQGIAVSPIQLVRAYSAVANGGYLVRPHVVKRVQSSKQDPEVLWEAEIEKKEALSPLHARTMSEMLTEVVQKERTGSLAIIPGFQVAGKTGTAQKLVEVETSSGSTYKTYSSSVTRVSFIGFVPAKNPAFVLYVMYDEPEYPASGGMTAAPSFKRMATSALAVLGIRAPKQASKEEPMSDTIEKEFVGKSFREVLEELKKLSKEEQQKVELFGYGKAVRQEEDESGIRLYFE